MWGTWTLGRLTKALEDAVNRYKAEPESRGVIVRFDFGNYPAGLASYRGFYDHLALAHSGQGGMEDNCKALVAELKEADGKTYTGYKGGDFKMGPNTPVWVANYSECPSCGISNVLDTGYGYLIIETRYVEV